MKPDSKKWLTCFFVGSLFILLSACQGEGNSESLIERSSQSDSSSEIESEEESPIVEIPSEEEILEEMTIEEKVGQLFLARMPEVETVELAVANHLGGYLWFAKDFQDKTSEMVQEEVLTLQEAMPIDLFMAVDEEGGDVTRVSSFSQFREVPFRSPRDEFQLNGWDGIEETARASAILLMDLGLNLNLAPVVDVPTSADDFIFSRSFSTNPTEVATYVERVVTIYHEEGVGNVLKHFPGYGNNVDTHTGVAYDERNYQTFLERDFLPFQAGIEAGTDMILVSHNVITAIDSDWPASLSTEVIQVLRNELGFSGLIMTDDLVMEGVQQFAEPGEAAVLAVLAGNDIVISSEFVLQIEAVLTAVEEGRISEERLNESVLRILRTKIRLGIIE